MQTSGKQRRAAAIFGLVLLGAVNGATPGSAAGNTCAPSTVGVLGSGSSNGIQGGQGTAGCLVAIPVQAYSLAVDPLDNVWYTTANGDVWELQTRGYSTGAYTSIASSVNNLHAQPRNIAVSGRCTNYCTPYVYFTEQGAAAIGRITLLGGPGSSAVNPVTSFPTPTIDSQPWGIALDSKGNAWFTESGIRSNGDQIPPVAQIGEMRPDGSMVEYPLVDPTAQPMGITVEHRPDGDRIWFTEYAANRVGVLVPRGNGYVLMEYDGLSANSGPLNLTVGNSRTAMTSTPATVPSALPPNGPATTDIYVTEIGVPSVRGSGMKIGRLTVANNVGPMPKATAVREYLTGWNGISPALSAPWSVATDVAGDIIYTLPGAAKFGILPGGEGIPQEQGQQNYSGVVEFQPHFRPFSLAIDPSTHDMWFVNQGSKSLAVVQNPFALPNLSSPTQCAGL